ncbi:MAG: pyridoxamine 5'-phosphate oxidase [Cyclobacteriaceae bacterium]
MKGIAEIRTEYSKASLDVATVYANPVDQFKRWLNEAVESKIPEPTAMSLATISEGGRPSARIVLLKGVENECFLFYTNYQSQKGRELEKNTACALLFFWPELERQVRIEGVAVRLDPDTSEAYFQSRPRSSQVGAWASPQSAPIQNREILEQRVKQIEERFKGKEVLPRPHQWGGYAVEPFEIEFWQGRPSRLHDRVLYTRAEKDWKINRLAP